MIRRALDWIGSARRENDAITSDAVRITALELALRQSNLKAMVWQTKAEDLQDKLDNVNELYAADFPLIEYALRQKANRARYDAKRRRR